MSKKRASLWKKLLALFLCLLSLLILAGLSFVAFLWINEYNPAPIEAAVTISPPNPRTLTAGQSYRILTYNIGYAGLGEKQDFFMDGGQMVQPERAEDVKENLEGISEELLHLPADFYLLQEVDEYGQRSFDYNEVEYLARSLDLGYNFTYNFKVPYVPYPFPPIGQVASGLQTLSPHVVNDSYRVALPIPFRWPERLGNLKRCLLVSRYRIEDSDKEFVLINLHLDAYDKNNEGKVAQTKVLLRLLQEEYAKGNYVIAGGDWNQILPGTPSTKLQPDVKWQPSVFDSSLLPSGWTFAVDKQNFTDRLTNRPYKGNEASAQLYAIDGFLLSPNVQLEQVEVISTNFRYADHTPVQLDFRLLADKPASGANENQAEAPVADEGQAEAPSIDEGQAKANKDSSAGSN